MEFSIVFFVFFVGTCNAYINMGMYKQQILDLHNNVRRMEPATNMQRMEWSNALQNEATMWASNCMFDHQRGAYGENLAMHTATWDYPSLLNTGITMWAEEKQFYTYGSSGFSAATGHYTQMVWADTTHVGCGMTRCPSLSMGGGSPMANAWFLVCFYSPPGNHIGKLPYVYGRGSPCSQCGRGQYCDVGLCANSPGTGYAPGGHMGGGGTPGGQMGGGGGAPGGQMGGGGGAPGGQMGGGGGAPGGQMGGGGGAPGGQMGGGGGAPGGQMGGGGGAPGGHMGGGGGAAGGHMGGGGAPSGNMGGGAPGGNMGGGGGGAPGGHMGGGGGGSSPFGGGGGGGNPGGHMGGGGGGGNPGGHMGGGGRPMGGSGGPGSNPGTGGHGAGGSGAQPSTGNAGGNPSSPGNMGVIGGGPGMPSIKFVNGFPIISLGTPPAGGTPGSNAAPGTASNPQTPNMGQPRNGIVSTNPAGSIRISGFGKPPPNAPNAAGNACRDKPYCGMWAELCIDPKYGRKIATQCPVTCGKCSPGGGGGAGGGAGGGMGGAGQPATGAACVDNTSGCAFWKQVGMCNVPFFQTYIMETCARTCMLC